MTQLLSATKFIPHPYAQLTGEEAILPGMTEALYQRALDRYEAMEDFSIERIFYKSHGWKVTGLRMSPVEAAEGSLPLIIFNRGGNREYGKLTINYIMAVLIPLLRKKPMLMLAPQYRGNDGGEGREDLGVEDVEDVLSLIALGKDDPRWDGKNVFMFGWSFGGFKTYNAIRAGAKVNAAVIGAGPVDMGATAAARPDMEAHVYAELIPDWYENRQANIEARSAIYWPEKLKDTPLLLLHGDKDWRVDVEQARRMDAALTAINAPHRYIEYAGGDHGLMHQRPDWMEAIVNWLTQYQR